MTQQDARSFAEQDGLSEDFKQKVGEWEASSMFGKIAAHIDAILEKRRSESC